MIHSSAMANILQMTRSGRLADATDLIQASLAGLGPQDSPADLRADAQDGMRASLLPSPADPSKSNSGPTAPSNFSPQGSFADKDFRSSAGSLHYRLYAPVNAAAGMPLVVMLHGCTQSADDFARGTGMNALADELGFFVAYPSQSQAANAQKCWNWFRPGDQLRDLGEPALIAGITRQIIAEHDCDGQRVYIAGLSAGGAAAAIMANAYPDIYAAVGIHSGLPCGAARDLPSALMAMKRGGKPVRAAGAASRFVPVITFHGDRDTTVSEVNSRTIAALAEETAGDLTTRTETGQTNGKRRFTRTISVNGEGETMIEQWTVHGGGHAWFGGSPAGTYTDELGPDASREMLRFFLLHRIV